ncbi:hypothetical protein Tco_0676119 [Tanacetum coccineum]
MKSSSFPKRRLPSSRGGKPSVQSHVGLDLVETVEPAETVVKLPEVVEQKIPAYLELIGEELVVAKLVRRIPRKKSRILAVGFHAGSRSLKTRGGKKKEKLSSPRFTAKEQAKGFRKIVELGKVFCAFFASMSVDCAVSYLLKSSFPAGETDADSTSSMPPDRDRVNALVILDDEAYRNTFAVPPNLLVIAFELGKAFTWSWLFLLQQRKDALIPRLAASFSTSKALDCLFVKQSFKQRGWAVHFIDLTSLYLRLKRGAGRAVKAHLVDSERAASTYSYQNEKQQAELELKKRASIRERKAVAHLSPEEPTLKGCKQRKVLTLSPTLFSDDVPWAKGDTILFLSSIVPIRTSGLVRFVLLSTQFSVFVRDHVGRKVACLPSHPLEKLVARKKRRGSEAVYEALLLPLKRTTSILGAHGAVYEEWLFGPFRPVVRTSSFHVEDTSSIPVLAKVGKVAYRLELPQELSRVHHTFHVSNLKKCYADEPLVMPLEGIHVDDKLQFVEEPVEIMEREIKRLKRSRIPLVKVRWNSRRGPEFTWEREDSFKQKYPQLFTNRASSSTTRS